MYLLLQKDQNSLPTVISENNPLAWDFKQAGYEILSSGTRREMEIQQAAMMENYADILQLDFN